MDRFEVSFAELDLMGDALGLDVRPFPFTFPSVGRDWDSRLRAIVQGNDAMVERGLIRDGRFIPELERAVGLLARGQVGVGVVGTGNEGELIARATTDGRAAMLAQQMYDGLRIALGRAEELVPWLLGLLPQHPRGPGGSATIPVPAGTSHTAESTDVDALDAFSYIRPEQSAAKSTRERDRDAATKILSSERYGGGYFLIESHSGARHTLNWIDNEAGRYASYSTFDATGNESVVYTPADFRLLGEKLHGYVATAGQGTKTGTVTSQFR